MTSPLTDKAVEAGARALANCSARVKARGIENVAINWPMLREQARACLTAALAKAEGK